MFQTTLGRWLREADGNGDVLYFSIATGHVSKNISHRS